MARVQNENRTVWIANLRTVCLYELGFQVFFFIKGGSGDRRFIFAVRKLEGVL